MPRVKLIADLHIHSRFSRATSHELDFVALYRAALLKGIGLVGTGDFTHPGWMAEIEKQLEPAEDGWFKLRPDLARIAEQTVPPACRGEVRFVLQVEISNIYKKQGKTRKNHNLVFVPTLEAAKRFSTKLGAVGNLASDGRPILGLDARHLLEMTLESDPLAFLVPAHIWTPWFSLFGSKSGFDSIKDCFEDLSSEIFAVETGLSSDPPMNWRVAELDRLTLISNSDAHSPAKLGREANLLDIEFGYVPMRQALEMRQGFLGTLEFFPEHGKYHLDGHRKCGLRLSPQETRDYAGRCPTCGGSITVGVMSRVLDLADPERAEGYTPPGGNEFRSLVPLDETVAEVLDVGSSSRRVVEICERIVSALGPELYVLKDAPLEDIEAAGGFPLREAIRRIRSGELALEPGYDGEFGNVRVFSAKERAELVGQTSIGLTLEAPKVVVSRPPEPRDSKASHQPAQESLAPRSAHEALNGLNPAQLEVVHASHGPLIVSAGPGTGKTKTLTERIVHHVRQGAWKPERVLALTFTNQAASELTKRLDAALADLPESRPEVMTFHRLGRWVLESLFAQSVTIADDETRLAVMTEALGGEISERRAQELLDTISLAKQSADPLASLNHDVAACCAYQRYQALLEIRGLFDLDDLVLASYRMLKQQPQVAGELARRFDAVSVDEYQDVNDVQAAWIELLCPNGSNLLVIGDPDQAIYGFRGARPGHFTRFAEAYPGARAVSLDVSYRLPQPVLEVAQAILGSARTLTSTRPGPKVEIAACPTEASEAEQLLVRIEQLLGGTSHFALNTGRAESAEEPSLGFGDIAVLCRVKAQRGAILTALSRTGIPCLMVGEDEPHDPRSEKVAIMTMHASKGREFEIVFIVGAEPGLMPLDVAGLASDPAEERRLFYVAATRARRRLVISYSKQRVIFGQRLTGGRSPYLAHLPTRCVETRSALLGRRSRHRQLALF